MLLSDYPLLDNLMEGCHVIGYDFRYLYVNNALAKHAKKSKDELLGHTIMELYPGIEATHVFSLIKKCMQERKPAELENEFTYPDGEKGWFEVKMEPVPDGVFILSIDISERKRTEMELKNQLRRIEALREIDIAILSTTDLSLALKIVLEKVTDSLNVDAADILLLDPHTHMLEFAAGRGFRSRGIEKTRFRLGQGYPGRAILEQKVICIPDLKDDRQFLRAPLIEGENFATFYALPLIAKGKVVGALEVFHRAPIRPEQTWMDFLITLAGQAAIAIDSGRLSHDLHLTNIDLILAYETTIEGWSRALDLRDKETEGHTLRVTELTIAFAKMAGIADNELTHVKHGALLHDIGKMGVPDAILLKPDKLTEEEWVIMRKHPVYAYDLLNPIEYLKPALSIPYSHHEKWDGTGYPQGLKGLQIPLPARLFAIIDVWDALRSDRPYRPRWPEEKVLDHITAQAGTHFEPKAVDVFLRLIKGGWETLTGTNNPNDFYGH